MGRVLFLHHYLPAAVCNYMLLGAILQFMFVDGLDSPISNLNRNKEAKRHRYISFSTYLQASPNIISYIAFSIILICQLSMFIFMAPITYGTPGLSVPEVQRRQIYSSWDLQFGKHIYNK